MISFDSSSLYHLISILQHIFLNIGKTATCSGDNHNGKLPAQCSIKTANKPSILHKRRSMNHDRSVLSIVSTNVFQLESFWKRIIYLNSSELPSFFPKHLSTIKVQLRSIKKQLLPFQLLFSSPFPQQLQ